MMDYRQQIFDMLGVKPNEEFKIRYIKGNVGNDLYRITENLELQYKQEWYGWDDTQIDSISDILKGEQEIVKVKVKLK